MSGRINRDQLATLIVNFAISPVRWLTEVPACKTKPVFAKAAPKASAHPPTITMRLEVMSFLPNAKLSYPDQALNSCEGVDGEEKRS
jgi:hypothetical protein